MLPNEGFYRGNPPRPLDKPLSTVTASRGFGALIEPFITRYHGGAGSERRNHSLANPLPAVDTSNRYGLAEPLLVEYHGQSKPFPVSRPVKTVTTKDRFGLLEPFATKVNHSGGQLDNPLGAVTTKRDNAIVQPFVINSGHSSAKNRSRSVDEPLSTIVTKAEHYLIEPGSGFKLDIRFRMLKNHELKRAQGFSKDYKILGTITEQTKQIGNAVPVKTAKALALAVMRKS